MIDPHAYRQIFCTWRYPSDKYVPVPINPPYRHPKFPQVSWREDWPVLLIVGAVLALGAMLRLIGDVLR